MTIRRPRPARASRSPRTPGLRSYSATSGSVGGGELLDAAEEIADGARRNAAGWSVTIPANIRTEQHDENHVDIVADADPAYPNETGSRHPVYARGPDRRKWTWTRGNNRPFLAPAAEQRSGPALAKYAKKVDRLVKESGL
jgi:hypothetical protein